MPSLDDRAPERVAAVAELAARLPWAGGPTASSRSLWRPSGRSRRFAELASETPERPSEVFRLAEPWDPAQLLVARALGAEWLDRYAGELRQVRLDITGEDLLRRGSRRARRSGGASRRPCPASSTASSPAARRSCESRLPSPGARSGGLACSRMEWRERDGVRWLEAELPDATAAFSTRVGGVSEPPYEALNVAVRTGDERDRVRENRARLAAALGRAPESVVMGRQVHGAELRRHDAPQQPRVYADAARSPDEVDAHATADPALTPLVMVADCLPVALSGPGGVAMAHCGWRGLAGGIAGEAASAVDATAAAIGPGIGPCCYEVGEEVLAEFSGLEGVATGRMLDLGAVAARLLERAGVETVDRSDLCTSCNPDLFYSHRRDGERTGRQAGLVWRAGG